jgi:hypothetical protein
VVNSLFISLCNESTTPQLALLYNIFKIFCPPSANRRTATDFPPEPVSGFLAAWDQFLLPVHHYKKYGGVWGAAPVPSVIADKLSLTE